MAKEKKEKRFEVVLSEGTGLLDPQVKIFRDKVTGVQYLFVDNGNSGGLTPLLDWEGRPVTDRP